MTESVATVGLTNTESKMITMAIILSYTQR